MKIGHYITYNDIYNGIYQSQVIDVVTHLNKTFEVDIKLIAFVPVRLWLQERRNIKAKLPNAKVFPILGRLAKIERTSLWLKLISHKQTAICRGPLAFKMSENNFKKLIYDGRAAVEAEVTEYNVTGSKTLDQLLIAAENEAIQKADFYMAVSEQLVLYWQGKLNSKIPKEQYVVIPCTLTSENSEIIKNNVPSENIKVVYAGGTGPWQSFEKVVALLDDLMTRQTNVEALFLTKEHEALEYLIKKHPERCSRKWVNHDQVYDVLASCDYGILLREDNITNRVASPVKFAEYLNAGLKVLISTNIGDFSEFTINNGCGILITEKISELQKINKKDETLARQLCNSNFKKDSPKTLSAYKALIKQFEQGIT